MFTNLKAEMVRKGMNAKNLAENLNFSYPTFVKKISGQTDFTYSEIKKITDYLGLTF